MYVKLKKNPFKQSGAAFFFHISGGSLSGMRTCQEGGETSN